MATKSTVGKNSKSVRITQKSLAINPIGEAENNEKECVGIIINEGKENH